MFRVIRSLAPLFLGPARGRSSHWWSALEWSSSLPAMREARRKSLGTFSSRHASYSFHQIQIAHSITDPSDNDIHWRSKIFFVNNHFLKTTSLNTAALGTKPPTHEPLGDIAYINCCMITDSKTWIIHGGKREFWESYWVQSKKQGRSCLQKWQGH